MFAYVKPEQKQVSKSTIQKKEPEKKVVNPNQTGIPDTMKTRFENLSGFSFNDVRVHYNSGKPAQLQSLAYTQGNQVYVGPRQEKHLGHELAHVVQQKQGRVNATTFTNGIYVNDDEKLEREAESGHIMQLKTDSQIFNHNSRYICQRCDIDKKKLSEVLSSGYSKLLALFTRKKEDIIDTANEYIINTNDSVKGFRAGYDKENECSDRSGFKEKGSNKSTNYGTNVFWGNAIYFVSDKADTAKTEDGQDYSKLAPKNEFETSQEMLARTYVSKQNPQIYSINFEKQGYYGFDLTRMLSDIAKNYCIKAGISDEEVNNLISNKTFLDITGSFIGILKGKSSLDVLHEKEFFLHGVGGTDCAFSDSVFDSSKKPKYEVLPTKNVKWS